MNLTLNYLRHGLSVLTAVMIAIGASNSLATVVPVGLNIGDPYYLAFVTEGTQIGNSSLISTYNNFVQSEAALNPALTGTNLGVQYKAVGSTSSVSAISNLGLTPGVPVYLMDGTTQIATVNGSGWLGAILSTPINITQYGVFPAATPIGYPYVWTGTEDTGLPQTNSWLGGPFAPRIGTWFYNDNRWVEISTTSTLATLRMYAVSSLLHVPTVPEPATAALVAMTTTLALFVRRTR